MEAVGIIRSRSHPANKNRDCLPINLLSFFFDYGQGEAKMSAAKKIFQEEDGCARIAG